MGRSSAPTAADMPADNIRIPRNLADTHVQDLDNQGHIGLTAWLLVLWTMERLPSFNQRSAQTWRWGKIDYEDRWRVNLGIPSVWA